MGAYRKLLHALDNHGFLGVLRRNARKLKFRESEEPHPFDRLHRTDTSGHIPGEKLAGNTASDLYNTAYYGISPSTLRHALALFPEALDGFEFLDLGCGKGRALMVAAEFPFTRIAGVELSHNLCEIALANTASEPRIAIQEQDAATFEFPDGPLVVYLYHPFLKPVLRRVLRKLERGRSAHPTYLLYAGCPYEKLMAKFPFLQVVWDYSIPLSGEDAAADRHGITHERFTLYRAAR